MSDWIALAYLYAVVGTMIYVLILSAHDFKHKGFYIWRVVLLCVAWPILLPAFLLAALLASGKK